MAKEKKRGESRDFVSDMRDNPWVVVSVLLGIVVIVLLVLNYASSCPGSDIGKEKAGKKVLDFVQSQGVEAEVKKVEDESGLYRVTLSIAGGEQEVHVTKDGENLVQTVFSFEEIERQQEIQRQAAQEDNESGEVNESL